jgi:hypothetical protein
MAIRTELYASMSTKREFAPKPWRSPRSDLICGEAFCSELVSEVAKIVDWTICQAPIGDVQHDSLAWFRARIVAVPHGAIPQHH